MMRTIAVGDIHGCALALHALLDAIAPQSNDVVVTLGDYVDRGPNSCLVLDQLIELGQQCQLVPLLGNHEEMLLAARLDRAAIDFWLQCGGFETLQSYFYSAQVSDLPGDHLRFLESCREWFETDQHFFVHAHYDPNTPLESQSPDVLRWEMCGQDVSQPHASGKTAIVGHTEQPGQRVLDLGFLKCLDTACYRGGCLTALDVDSGMLWQSDESGHVRESQLCVPQPAMSY